MIPAGSETEYVRSSSTPFRPQFCSDYELKIITRMMENLLGHVDASALAQAVQWFDLYLHSVAAVRDAALKLDPLHRALAIAYSGESAVRELETAALDRAVRSGLAALERLSREQYGHEFLSLDESQATKLIVKVSTEESGSPVRILYELTRSESIRGYYTSAEGLKELDYKGNWYYPQCPGCARP
jgi:gluconate 2-dehydrogenase subunit 3-like protein